LDARKDRADTIVQPQFTNQAPDYSDESEADEEIPEQKQKCQTQCKKNQGLPPRKALKGLIFRELDKIAP